MDNSISAHINQITADNIFWIIIINFFQIAKFPFPICIGYHIGHLNVKLMFSPIAYKIHLIVIQLTYLNFIAPA